MASGGRKELADSLPQESGTMRENSELRPLLHKHSDFRQLLILTVRPC